eukprot:7422929-Pyramimonas_sp.AAC.2
MSTYKIYLWLTKVSKRDARTKVHEVFPPEVTRMYRGTDEARLPCLTIPPFESQIEGTARQNAGTARRRLFFRGMNVNLSILSVFA